jgi:hypothetical protein
MTPPVFPPAWADGETHSARTQAALRRLSRAMADIEADIAAHHGLYPFNFGRVTQSELCRRADVKKATLQNPLHKNTTRVGILAWLDGLNATLAQTREGTRERVTTVADNLANELERLTRALDETRHALAVASERVAQLERENTHLRSKQPGH